MTSMIIEESESLALHRMMTVRTSRGDEFVIDADEAAKALAELFSDFDNERRGRWQLNVVWYEREIKKLRNAACPSIEDFGG